MLLNSEKASHAKTNQVYRYHSTVENLSMQKQTKFTDITQQWKTCPCKNKPSLPISLNSGKPVHAKTNQIHRYYSTVKNLSMQKQTKVIDITEQ